MADTLGSLLRKKRESLGLTLEKVEGFTRIRVKHLQAIESDDLSTIPSVVQARGFIRNYAAFLGFDPDELAGRIGATKLRPEKSRPPAVRPKPAGEPSAAADRPAAPGSPPEAASARPHSPITAPVVPRTAARAKPRPSGRARLRMDMLLGAAVTLVVVALLGWGGYHIALSVRGPATPTPTAPPETAPPAEASAASLAAPTDAGTAAPGSGPAGTDTAAPETAETGPAITPGTLSVSTPSATTVPTPWGGVYTDVRINVIVLQRAFLEVDVDGVRRFSGRVLPGQSYDFIGRQTVKISTGNGAAIRIVFNGVDEGKMGGFGEVASKTYTPTGVLAPTAAPTATPAVTPTPTSTKTP
ncbi:MAG: helix-turn-helix domain-containing protein [Anaerolineales bacterium]|nr:helix-turn-helix domain-containing protein [Anaerolineales bacterium]